MSEKNDRLQVIRNIKLNAESENFHAKVETTDPVMSCEEIKKITDNYLKNRKKLYYKTRSFFARRIANIASLSINKKTEIIGEISDSVIKNGAIITSNHFSPVDNTVIRFFARKNGIKRLNIISQATNFAMKGVRGFLMNYADTIPLSNEPKYLSKSLTEIIEEKINKKELVLIYPEQEMWFNYRKPRPHKEGAYHFAAKLGVPIISCFVEILDEKELDNDDFFKVKYRLHVLDVLYPDKEKSTRENRIELCERDYGMKKEAYEKIYEKTLDYKFSSDDIAGWIDYDSVEMNCG